MNNYNYSLFIAVLLSVQSCIGMHTNNHKRMHGMYGNYVMNREASGTSWVPDSSKLTGFHRMHNNWMFMVSGFSCLVFDNQRGPRGEKKIYDTNMLMFMTQQDINEQATIGLRTMFSLEPVTIGKCGYPLLLQTGETCDGITPLIDRQHPHDLFMELALVGTYRINPDASLFLYAGLPGEPALGPPTFMMRFASQYIPESPIGHHWIDSTHITFGVITGGFVYKGLKIEVSGFRGREPDQLRYDIEKPRIDSYSFRFSTNPTENLALQISHGFIKSPEQLDPQENIARTVCSAIYNRSFGQDSVAQLAAIIGINDEQPGILSSAFLIDITAQLYKKHILFSRFEAVEKNDLFLSPDPLADQKFTVKKLTLGYIYEPFETEHSQWGIGGLIDFPLLSQPVRRRYGDAISFSLFFDVRII